MSRQTCETTLSEVCAPDGFIQTGPFGSQLHMSDYASDGVPVIMPTNLGDGFVVEQGIMRTSSEKADSLSRHKVREGDIVYSRRGDITRRALVTDAETGWLCGTGCLLIRPSREVNSRWLSYWLAQPRIHDWLISHAVGATMLNLNTSILGALPVTLPALPEQQRIAGVLGAFDNLIETNRSLASDCERLLFASVTALAVDAPSVPLGSLAVRVNERVLPSEMEDEWYLGLEHFGTDGVGLNSRGSTKGVTSQSQRFERGDVLYGKLRPYFQKVARPGFGGVCSGEIWVLRAVDGYPQAALHAVVHSKRFSEIATAGSGGTKMPRADWRHMAEFPVPDVRNVLTRSGAQALEDLWGAACELRAEADNLIRQHDELLPLLMSGKVRVSEIEGSVP